MISVSGSNNIIDNCKIVSNGLGDCIFAGGDTNLTITNNYIEVLHNTDSSDADCIFIDGGGGGHTIMGNTMYNGKTDNTYHPDFIQTGNDGGTNRPLFTIANNFMCAPYTDMKL